MERKNEVTRNLLQQEPGREKRHSKEANTQCIPQTKTSRQNISKVDKVRTTEASTSRDAQTVRNLRNSIAANVRTSSRHRLQILHLRHLHGLTEAHAQAIASLIWGAS